MSLNVDPFTPSKYHFFRIFGCIFRQESRLIRCPDMGDLTGVNVLITGGTSGIGEFISRHLIAVGATVTSLSRGESLSSEKVGNLRNIQCDLSSAESVVDAVSKIEKTRFHIVICNAGVLVNQKVLTSNNMEKTYAVNVFGHHLLYRLLIERGMLAVNARIILTAGEAYLSSKKCQFNPDKFSAFDVYGGSKLGNLWQMREIVKRYPNLTAYAVHPGVIASGFGATKKSGFTHWLKSKLLISEEQGAQATLIAATQDLPNGCYWHNARGVMQLADDDVANNEVESEAFWDELEELARPWL